MVNHMYRESVLYCLQLIYYIFVGEIRALVFMIFSLIINKNSGNSQDENCQRPYHVENTGSRPITEVKQRRA